MIKAVFFDIDGTLVPWKSGRIPASVFESVAALRRKGILCFVATGRSPFEISAGHLIDGLDFDGYLLNNGELGVDADGTPTVHTATTEDGATFYYTEQFVVETTAYTWTGNTTFTGTWPKQGTIAVDPDVIPLGTQVYIVGYGFATAEDTGGAIDGEIVDLYMDTEEACIAWGRRDAVVYILAE